MKILLLSALLAMTVPTVQADGFRCSTEQSQIKLTVYNFTEAARGIRTPAILIVSDPKLERNHQTLVSFDNSVHHLNYQGYGRYQANLDQTQIDEAHREAPLGGARLGDLSGMVVDIDFSYAHDAVVLANTVSNIPGKVVYQLSAGEAREEKIACTRYHKAD